MEQLGRGGAELRHPTPGPVGLARERVHLDQGSRGRRVSRARAARRRGARLSLRGGGACDRAGDLDGDVGNVARDLWIRARPARREVAVPGRADPVGAGGGRWSRGEGYWKV